VLKGYPNLDSYLIKWNQGRDSLFYKLDRSADLVDTIRILLDQHIAEGATTFVIYSKDKQGNRSLPTEITALGYGDGYRSLLSNRRLNTAKPYSADWDGQLVLHFNTPDTINIRTDITYTTKSGGINKVELAPNSSDARLPSYRSGTKIFIQSSYVPHRLAIDTFTVMRPDSIVVNSIKMDKGLYKAVSLVNDAKPYDASTTLDKLWNGNTSPSDYPNIFHTDGATMLPHHFTLDLGKGYEFISDIELIGRSSNHNPVEVEVWGTDNIQNAATSLPGNDSGWTDESKAKGWHMLGKLTRTDSGNTPMKFALQKAPKSIRYVRLRILKVSSGSTNYSNLSEVSFWHEL